MLKVKAIRTGKRSRLLSCSRWVILLFLLLCITLASACGEKVSDTPSPAAGFTATPTSGTAPLEVNFTDSSSGKVTSWEWDFDGDDTADSTEQNPSYTYQNTGTYTVSLTVTGPGGSDNETKPDYIVVSAQSPALAAEFTAAQLSGAAPFSVQFTDSSTGTITSWNWDFDGDGNIDSNEQNPTFTYQSRGNYTVSLIVTNSDGTEKETKSDYINVSAYPWTYDADWWEETYVWYFGQPLGSGDEYYYSVVDDTGVGAVSWIDIRFLENWEDKIAEMVDRLHSRGIYVVGTLSMMTHWQELYTEPADLVAATICDPFGNVLSDSYGNAHSMIHPDWKEYLLDCMKTIIDIGVDGFLTDEIAYGSVFYPDFNANTMELFRQYLDDTYTDPDLAAMGISDISTYDYAQVIQDELTLKGVSSVTKDTWIWDLYNTLPLINDYQRFLREENRNTVDYLITEAKAYAQTEYDNTLPFSANLSDLTAPEALQVVDLFDYVELEWHYKDNGYFPQARAFASVKLARFFGINGNLLTDMNTRADIANVPAGSTPENVDLYKTLIADAYAGGGAFNVEHGAHGVIQDLVELAPYYNFVTDNPGLFNSLDLYGGDIGVLHLWEAVDIHNATAYRGLCNLLADCGYQFDTIFGGQEYLWGGEENMYPAPQYQLTIGELTPYSVIIIPEMYDIIEEHADLLLQYVNNGGKLIVCATTENTDDINNQRGGETNIAKLLGYLNGGSQADITNGGKIIRVTDIWGKDYLTSPDFSLRNTLKTTLKGETSNPEVEYADSIPFLSAFAYERTGCRVIHLVNYNYNKSIDTTTPIASLDLEIPLDGLVEGSFTVTYYTPENPQGESISTSVAGSTISLTISDFGIWGVLVIE